MAHFSYGDEFLSLLEEAEYHFVPWMYILPILLFLIGVNLIREALFSQMHDDVKNCWAIFLIL